MAVEASFPKGTITFGAAKRLFGGVVTSRGILYAPSRDGQKFLVVPTAAAAAQPLTAIQNWPALLK